MANDVHMVCCTQSKYFLIGGKVPCVRGADFDVKAGCSRGIPCAREATDEAKLADEPGVDRACQKRETHVRVELENGYRTRFIRRAQSIPHCAGAWVSLVKDIMINCGRFFRAMILEFVGICNTLVVLSLAMDGTKERLHRLPWMCGASHVRYIMCRGMCWHNLTSPHR